MAGAPTVGGGRSRTARDRWLVLGAVGVLVVAVVGVGAFALRSGQSAATPSPAASSASGLSPLDEALQGINDDGTYSKETALAVFAAAFGPLPGVPTPRVDASYHSGTLAIQMVSVHWTELTDEQRAAIRAYVGKAAATALPAAFRVGGFYDTIQGIVNANTADITAKFGRPLGIPIDIVAGDTDKPGEPWAWATANFTGPDGTPASSCSITIPPATFNDRSRDPYMRWLLLHEVWHCFEYTMVGYTGLKSSPPWVVEGEASFVAESITGGQGAPPPEFDHWRHYVEDPGKPLYGRDYDAIGFYAQMAQNNIDVWKVLQPMMQAAGSDPALQASGAAASSFADRWGSSWFRDAAPTIDWAMNGGYGIPPTTVRAGAQAMEIADGTTGTLFAKQNAGGIAAVHTTAFITEFEAVGAGRVADPGGTLDKIVRAGKLDLCTNPAGDCKCPEGATASGDEPDRAPPSLHAAVTGEEYNPSQMGVRGISQEEWCKPAPSSRPPGGGGPCASGCGGSSGDPHLKTVDGNKYDLQAAGEYVLLRSADGSIEIQGRQEPPCVVGAASPPPSFGTECQVTINTAVAVKENGHRIGFYVSSDVPTVRVDGQPVDASHVATADVGPGAKLTGYRRGYELDLADGTKIWALSVGQWGINLLVKPSTPLFASGVGLIAQVPISARLRVPALPDGTTLPMPTDRHDQYHQVYEVLAPAWRVTDATTLFDYDTGRTAASYVVAAYPPETAPVTTADLDPTILATARTTCAGVTDADLADQCAYDTAVTGETGFATLYEASDQLQTIGTSTLDLAPGASPPSQPPSGGAASGVNLVEDGLANTSAFGVGSHTLGPDGTVYVEVGEPGQSFGDVTTVLIAIDGPTGHVKQRATADGGGLVAFAAGSLWVDAFKRPATGCAVARLDAASLAVQATVPIVCGPGGQSIIVPFDDALWFVDPTGADASGTGGHLRRIDPASNAPDSGPAGSIAMPFVSPFLGVVGSSSFIAPTSAGLIYGEPGRGFYRLTTGSTSFDSLGNPSTGYHAFPAGDGLWLQTEVGTQEQPESTAAFYDGGATAARQLTVQYFVVGADEATVYTAWVPSDDQADGLWSNPIDGSPPTRIATAATVPSASTGTTRLQYQDPLLPLQVGDHVLVKLWVAPSPTSADTIALYVQSIPVP